MGHLYCWLLNLIQNKKRLSNFESNIIFIKVDKKYLIGILDIP
jgi:hypothetical protein